MGIEVTKDGKMINTCDWPDCGCREVVKWRYDKSWGSFGGNGWSEDDWQNILGLPTSGMLCMHHNEAWDAGQEGDWDRLMLLASI
jgi:hypothetical protein